MDTAELLREIDEAFPSLPKPSGKAVCFHETDCWQCDYVGEYLDEFSSSDLPDEAIFYLHNELSCISASGWKWLMRPYLRRCVTQEATYGAIETEFLIYNLAPKPEFQSETRQRLSLLSVRQIECLLNFIGWCQTHPHWSDYCSEEIEQAQAFLPSLLVGPREA